MEQRPEVLDRGPDVADKAGSGERLIDLKPFTDKKSADDATAANKDALPMAQEPA